MGGRCIPPYTSTAKYTCNQHQLLIQMFYNRFLASNKAMKLTFDSAANMYHGSQRCKATACRHGYRPGGNLSWRQCWRRLIHTLMNCRRRLLPRSLQLAVTRCHIPVNASATRRLRRSPTDAAPDSIAVNPSISFLSPLSASISPAPSSANREARSRNSHRFSLPSDSFFKMSGVSE